MAENEQTTEQPIVNVTVNVSPEATAAAGPSDDAAGVSAADAAPFVDDIIIWTDGLEMPRKLTQEALKKLPPLAPSMMPPINSLIKQGVTIAAIPTTSGIGAACYLVNLASLKRPDEDT